MAFRESNKRDVEKCLEEIKVILGKYGCIIEWEDYSAAWIRDIDTDESVSLKRAG